MAIKNVAKAKKLGDLLVELGMLTGDQLKEAVALQRARGGNLGDSLVELKLLSREVLLSFLGKRCGVSYVALSECGPVDPAALSLVPSATARRELLLPLRRRDNELTVAMADPLNVFATDDLRALTGCEIKVMIAAEGEIRAAIEAAYGEACEVPSVDGQVHFRTPVQDDEDAPPVVEGDEGRAANMLNVLLDNAARAGAQAVHLESGDGSLKVRYRLKGKMAPRPEIPGKFQEGLAARVKSLARMDPAECWAPQEGHIRARVSGRELDIRVSAVPAFGGEKIVLRFVETEPGSLKLDKLGLGAAALERYRKALEAPGGLILITGPAGTGKTSTFYAGLQHAARPERHVASLEDPIERCLPAVVQVQARPQAGLTLVSGVRAMMRQDADLIGMGELRTPEEILAAFEAAQAGAAVIATLRAASADQAVARVLKAGVPAEAAAACLKALVVQKWAKGLCPSCREAHHLPRQTLADMGFSEESLKGAGSGSLTFHRPKGCAACAKPGAGERVLLIGVMAADDGFRAEVCKGAAGKGAAAAMREAGLSRALEGGISLDEALR